MVTERGYHHGDLRASLIAKALEVVETDGYEVVSLRALAEQLGVTRGAPYRHFPERNQLLAEVAVIGFQRLHALAEAEAGRDAEPMARVVAAARQFLRFVDANPQLFRLMFEAGLLNDPTAHPQLAQAQSDTYATILAMFSAALEQQGIPASQARGRLIAFWATTYGYAKIKQASLLQTYMVGDLGAADIEDQVIASAIGRATL
jgi:AcrR family transcriptional regulator